MPKTGIRLFYRKRQTPVFHFRRQRDHLRLPFEFCPSRRNPLLQFREPLALATYRDLHIGAGFGLSLVALDEVLNAFALGYCIRLQIFKFSFRLFGPALM